MKKVVFYIIFLLITTSSIAGGGKVSPWTVGIAIGAANFLGDAGGGADQSRDDIRDIKFQKTTFSGGLYGSYRFSKLLTLGLNLYYARLAADDSLSSNPARFHRNTSFSNNVFEVSTQLEITIYSNLIYGHRYKLYGVKGRKKNNFRLYGLLGVGGFYHNPKTKLKNGDLVELQPIGTEGQYLSHIEKANILNNPNINPNVVINKPYSLYQINFPIGLGLTYKINSQFTIGYEISARYTLTDYIDDISNGGYLDSTFFKTPEGKELTNRPKILEAETYGVENNQIGFENNYIFPGGTPRGSAKRNDLYLYSLVKLNYTIQKSNRRLHRPKYEKSIRLVKPKERKAKPKDNR